MDTTRLYGASASDIAKGDGASVSNLSANLPTNSFAIVLPLNPLLGRSTSSIIPKALSVTRSLAALDEGYPLDSHRPNYRENSSSQDGELVESIPVPHVPTSSTSSKRSSLDSGLNPNLVKEGWYQSNVSLARLNAPAPSLLSLTPGVCSAVGSTLSLSKQSMDSDSSSNSSTSLLNPLSSTGGSLDTKLSEEKLKINVESGNIQAISPQTPTAVNTTMTTPFKLQDQPITPEIQVESNVFMRLAPIKLRPYATAAFALYYSQLQNPDTTFWSIWERLVLFVDIYNLLSIPWSIGWPCHAISSRFFLWCAYSSDFVLWIDVWLQLRRCYEDEYGTLETRNEGIKAHFYNERFGYFQVAAAIPLDLFALGIGSFLPTGLSLCPIHNFSESNSVGWYYEASLIPGIWILWACLRLTRWLRMPNLVQLFGQWSPLHKVHVTYSRLLKNFIVFLVAAHWDACLFFALNVWESNSVSWIDAIEMRQKDSEVTLITQYFESL
jgi:hypothetical protein